MRDICPFCYARWVADIWTKIDSAMVSSGFTRRGGQQGNTRIIDLSGGGFTEDSVFSNHIIERHYKTTTRKEDANEDPVLYLRRVMQYVVGSRKEKIKAYDPLGAMQYITFEPVDNDVWKLHYRTIMVVPADKPDPEDLKGRIVRHEEPTRKAIFRVVSRVCRYPRAWFTSPVEQMSIYMQAKRIPSRSGRKTALRMSATYGLFRNSRY
jgi:hypothetical protein